LLASAWSKRWLQALVRAAIVAILFLLTMGAVIGKLLWVSLSPAAPGWGTYGQPALATGLGFISTISTFTWAQPMYIKFANGATIPMATAPTSQLFWVIGQGAILSLLVLALCIVMAGSKIRRSWQEEPPSKAQLWFQAKFCTPMFWLSFFRAWMRRKLERNPIGWLEQRTWTGRLVTWGWFAVIISLYSAVFTDRNFFRGYSEIQRLMAWLLAGSMAMSAAGSFRRERESGVLELLLVSPLGESQIISGRLGGLWGQFLPAFGLLLAIWAYFSHLFRGDGDAEAILYYAVTFLALPVIGLYFSLRCRNFISAFLATIVVGLIVPLLLPALLKFLWSFDTFAPWEIGPSGRAAFFQAILSCICWFALHDRLKRRAFPLERTGV